MLEQIELLFTNIDDADNYGSVLMMLTWWFLALDQETYLNPTINFKKKNTHQCSDDALTQLSLTMPSIYCLNMNLSSQFLIDRQES